MPWSWTRERVRQLRVRSRFRIVSDRKLTIRCNKLVLRDEYSRTDNKDGNRTEMVVRSNVHWSEAKFLGVDVKQKLVMQHGHS